MQSFDVFVPQVAVAGLDGQDFFPPPPDSPEGRRAGGRLGRPRSPPRQDTVGCWAVSTNSAVEPFAGDDADGASAHPAQRFLDW